MAACQRVRLLSRCLVEQGANVTILCTRVSEIPPFIQNYSSKGIVDGINYEYTTGTTVRSKKFLFRRFLEIKGLLICIWKIIQYKKLNKISSIYLWALEVSLSRIIITIVAKLMNIPIVLELNERPKSLTENPTFRTRLISPLWGSSGVIAISDFLFRWCKETDKTKEKIRVIKVPILVDPVTYKKYQPLTSSPSVLFSGMPDYVKTIKFIFDAMEIVWHQIPSCILFLSGWRPEIKSAKWISSEIIQRSISHRVKFLGYLPREELLKQYQRSWGLLIPLFQDIRSQARFPTKIGEYLLSRRPIITTQVGEISSYFCDGINSYVCEPDNPSIYGFKILEVLKDLEQSKIIGYQGAITSKNCFNYRIYSMVVYEFFENILYR
jgi:glycosyltransferase involved in cell wall biosynthesis